MSSKAKLTTMDNPYNPFTQFREWHEYDEISGYHTLEMVAAFSRMSCEMDEEMAEAEIDYAIDQVLDLNPYGIHYKVYDYDADTSIVIANKAYKETVGTMTA